MKMKGNLLLVPPPPLILDFSSFRNPNGRRRKTLEYKEGRKMAERNESSVSEKKKNISSLLHSLFYTKLYRCQMSNS